MPHELPRNTPGTEYPVFETDFGRVGMAICWDLHFLDVVHAMTEQNVQLILWPSMYQGGFQLRMWAYLAGAYVVSAWPGNICEIIDMKRFGETQVVHFGQEEKVAGFSMVQLIETSLISAHFANLTNTAYIDVFSCKLYEPEMVRAFAEKFFGGDRSTLNVTLRR